MGLGGLGGVGWREEVALYVCVCVLVCLCVCFEDNRSAWA
jgi:hypothetical protein